MSPPSAVGFLMLGVYLGPKGRPGARAAEWSSLGKARFEGSNPSPGSQQAKRAASVRSGPLRISGSRASALQARAATV
jgi:hypothetical protein